MMLIDPRWMFAVYKASMKSKKANVNGVCCVVGSETMRVEEAQ